MKYMMKKTLLKTKLFMLLFLTVSLTSCGGYIQALNEYNNSPAGQERLRRQFVLDSIRASRTVYPIYNYNDWFIRRGWNRPRGRRVVVIPQQRRRTNTTRNRNYGNSNRNPRNRGNVPRVGPRSRRTDRKH